MHWRLLDRHSVLGRSVRPADAPPDHQAILHDLSVTGARLFAPADGEIVAGCGLEVQLGEQWSFVEVAWIGASPAPHAQWCGLRFVQPSQRFMAEVFRALDSLDPT